MHFSKKLFIVSILTLLASIPLLVQQRQAATVAKTLQQAALIDWDTLRVAEAEQLASDMLIISFNGTPDEQQAILETVVALYSFLHAKAPSNQGPLINRGSTYFHLGEYELAIADFNRIMADKPNLAALGNRAIVYKAMGEWEKASADFLAYIGQVEKSQASLGKSFMDDQLDMMRSYHAEVVAALSK